MQSGKIMEENSPEAMLSGFTVPLFEVLTPDQLDVLQKLRSMPEIQRAYLFGHSIHVAANSADCDAAALKNRLAQVGITNAEIKAVKANFEDCFIEAVEHHQT
jgi:hypothetical protein